MAETKVPTLSLHGAVTRFREAGISTSEIKIAAGIEQGVYPFGVCIKLDGSRNRCFEIYTKLLDKYLAERSENGIAIDETIIAMSMSKNKISGRTTDELMAGFSSIPNFAMNELIEPIQKCFITFFEQPEIKDKFEKWLDSSKKKRK